MQRIQANAQTGVDIVGVADGLDGLETLITHPSSTTPLDAEPELRRCMGITCGLAWISVGLEAPEDIIADLEQAFAAAAVESKRKRLSMKFTCRLVGFDPRSGDRFRPIATPIDQTAIFEQEHTDCFREPL